MSSIDSPARAHRLTARLDRAEAHDLGVERRHAAGDDPGEGSDAERLGLRLAHHQHGGGAVVERARVAGGDGAVGPEHRLQRRRGPRPWCPDAGRRPSSTTVPSGVVTGVISRSKNPFSCDATARCCEQRGELVHLLARDLGVLGHVLGRLAHRDVDVGQPPKRRPRVERRRAVRFSVRASASANFVVVRARPAVGHAGAEPAHRLDAAGDEHVALAGLDRVRGHADGLQRRRAVAVHGDAGRALEPGEERGHAGDVVPRLTGRLRAAPDDVLDLARVDGRAPSRAAPARSWPRGRRDAGRRATPCWPVRSGVRAVATMTASMLALLAWAQGNGRHRTWWARISAVGAARHPTAVVSWWAPCRPRTWSPARAGASTSARSGPAPSRALRCTASPGSSRSRPPASSTSPRARSARSSPAPIGRCWLRSPAAPR